MKKKRKVKLSVVPISPKRKLHCGSLYSSLDTCIETFLENSKGIVTKAEIIGVLEMLKLDRRDA